MLLDIISGKVTDFNRIVQTRTEANHMPKLACCFFTSRAIKIAYTIVQTFLDEWCITIIRKFTNRLSVKSLLIIK